MRRVFGCMRLELDVIDGVQFRIVLEGLIVLLWL